MQPPRLPTHRRHHDFDALRSAAMLLGIVLHGKMSLVPLPVTVWPAQDVAPSPVYLFYATPFTVLGCNYFLC